MISAQGFEETNLVSQRQRLLDGKATVDEIVTGLKNFYDFSYSKYANQFSDKALENLIMICNDIYSYSQTGEVLVTDRDYDMYMEEWIRRGNNRLIYPDNLALKKSWDIVTHKEPGLVGTVEKVYTPTAFMRWATNDQISESNIEEMDGDYPCYHEAYVIAPKYDGISAVITIHHKEVILALTRRDGYAGQDITRLITSIPSHNEILIEFFNNAFEIYGYTIEDMVKKVIDSPQVDIKCELLMSQENYLKLADKMTEEGLKPYANRRSAVSAIVNTPTNLKYAEYLTIMPLMILAKIRNSDTPYIIYAPGDSYRFEDNAENVRSLFKKCVSLLEDWRSPDEGFKYRMDGVVCFPLTKSGKTYVPYSDNELDYMDGSIAYKINLNEADTRIIRGYVSVGLLGKAIPMIQVAPVEVNETTVQDVSLGSWDNFVNMHLYKGEMVTIFSAGDVIPQAKVKEPRDRIIDSKPLKIKKRCPYCGEDLERRKAEYWCMNDECPHKAVGLITNFLTKIGAKDIGEGKVESLFNHGILKTIIDLFNGDTIEALRKDKYKGWDKISIDNLEVEINRLMSTPIEVSTFFGALGIRGMAKKKCRFIFKRLDEAALFGAKPFELRILLSTVDGISDIGADTFATYLEEHRREIKNLRSFFRLVPDKKYKGSVCFTGFRNDELAEEIDELGYEVTDSVTADTVLVITASLDSKSKKCATARKKGIPIEHVQNRERFIYMLSN